MSIVKISRKQNPFVMIEKSIFEDNTISWAAKGVMGYLLSKPDGWNVNVADIVNHSPVCENGQKRRGNGEEAVYKILKELRGNGYAYHEFKRDSKGVISSSEWTVFETKQPYPYKPDTAKPDAAKPDGVQPDGVQPDYNNNEGSNNDYSNKSKPKDAPQSGATPQPAKEYAKQSQNERMQTVYEYAKQKGDNEVLAALTSEGFVSLWAKYVQYRTTVKKTKYKTCHGEYTKIAELVRFSADPVKRFSLSVAEKIVQKTIDNEWTGLFPLKQEKTQQGQTSGQQTQTPPPNTGRRWTNVADLD